MPSKTTYKIQFVILMAHLAAIGLFLFAFVHATEMKKPVQKTLSIMSGILNFVVFMLRTVLELLYTNYHPENFVKD